MQKPDQTPLPDFVNGTINLASASLGARAIATSDEFFAPLSRMLSDDAPVFIPDKFDDNGKWMDGWESRRKRTPGHDWAIIQLARPGSIAGFNIDTSHFTGNNAPAASIEAVKLEEGETPDENSDWQEILSSKELGPDSHHFKPIDDPEKMGEEIWTHLRLHIYPDGGVARLRVYGQSHFDWSKVADDQEIDLAFLFHGAQPLHWSDSHYGSPEKLLTPGRGVNMGDGWETARRRGPGYDWTIIRLGHAGTISSVTIDTAHFKGNYPETGEVLGAYLPDHNTDLSPEELEASENWEVILPGQKLQMDFVHQYDSEKIVSQKPITHIRFNIRPDGGVSRLRINGKVFRG
ncbi:MAG: allantoicase [Rhizobiaceae bacterium]|nr:allantoicase [Rhizobiaceae bacterium]